MSPKRHPSTTSLHYIPHSWDSPDRWWDLVPAVVRGSCEFAKHVASERDAHETTTKQARDALRDPSRRQRRFLKETTCHASDVADRWSVCGCRCDGIRSRLVRLSRRASHRHRHSHPRSKAVPDPFHDKAPLVWQGVPSTKPSKDNPDTFQVKPRAYDSWHLLFVCEKGDRHLSMTMRCLSNG